MHLRAGARFLPTVRRPRMSATGCPRIQPLNEQGLLLELGNELVRVSRFSTAVSILFCR